MKTETENPEQVFEPLDETAPISPASVNSANSPADPAASAAAGDDLSDARRSILFGLLWCVGGLVFSFVSYYITEAGGRYVVATGAILYGLFQAVGGAFRILRSLYRRGDRPGFVRMSVLSVAALVVLGGLTSLSVRMVSDDRVEILNSRQRIVSESPALQLPVPAGYTPVEVVEYEETDDSYARTCYYTWNDETSIGLEILRGCIDDDEVAEVGDMLDWFYDQNESYFSGGLLAEPEIVETGILPMLKRSGLRTDNPETVHVTFDLVCENSVVTLYYLYPGTEIDPGYDRMADELAAGFEFD